MMTAKEDSLTRHLSDASNVVLAIEPVSRSLTRAAIAVSNSNQLPIILCPDPNTVDIDRPGSWQTTDFARFVKALDTGNLCTLARRSGGSLATQSSYTISESILRTKLSLTADLEAGFGLIHFAPSFGSTRPLDREAAMTLQFEMIEHCDGEAKRLGTSFSYEIGEGQRQIDDEDQFAFNQLITATIETCREKNLPLPCFAEGRTGTFIAGQQNKGSFGFDNPTADLLPASMQIPRIALRCRQLGLKLSTSQCDYLADASLAMFSTLGIRKASFGPEFGASESRRILQLCAYTRRQDLAERFYRLATQRYSSAIKTTELSREQREESIVRGYRAFHSDAYADIHLELETACAERGLDLNQTLEQMHRIRIQRLIRALRMKRVILPATEVERLEVEEPLSLSATS